MTRSLRFRLLLGASVPSAIVLGLLGVSVYAAMRHALMRDFARSLQSDGRLISGMIEGRGPKMKFEFDSQQLPGFVSANASHFFQIWRDDGTVLARSGSLGNLDLPRFSASTDQLRQLDLPGSRHGYAVALAYNPGKEENDDEHPSPLAQPLAIVVAADPVDVNHTLSLLGWLLTAACALAIAVMGAVLLRVVDQGVQPVKSLATEIESLTEADLGRRFARDRVPHELLPVVDKLNGLLQRLDGAFNREKSFTADVAHELRTPLTGLRMTLEVCRSQPRKALAYEAAIDECRGIIDRMGTMVESLLLLARSDAGQIALAREQVDLRRIILEKWCLFQEQAETLEITVSFDLADSLEVDTDAEKLGIVLRNLLDNAVSYVNQGGQIRIATRRAGADAIIEIANSGSAIAAEDTPWLFERFWRGDLARTDAVAHCGLGLSLCSRLMNLLGGEISVKTSKGGEFVTQIKLRLADRAVV